MTSVSFDRAVIAPCDRIKHIDKRYRTKYRASLTENLVAIKDNGIAPFLQSEVKKWTCPKCGSTLSVHRYNCPYYSYDSKLNSF
jgi:rubrerythrin